MSLIICKDCDGSGEIIKRGVGSVNCPQCEGTGSAPSENTWLWTPRRKVIEEPDSGDYRNTVQSTNAPTIPEGCHRVGHPFE